MCSDAVQCLRFSPSIFSRTLIPMFVQRHLTSWWLNSLGRIFAAGVGRDVGSMMLLLAFACECDVATGVRHVRPLTQRHLYIVCVVTGVSSRTNNEARKESGRHAR
jgi:hypothetical protein